MQPLGRLVVVVALNDWNLDNLAQFGKPCGRQAEVGLVCLWRSRTLEALCGKGSLVHGAMLRAIRNELA